MLSGDSENITLVHAETVAVNIALCGICQTEEFIERSCPVFDKVIRIVNIRPVPYDILIEEQANSREV